MAGQKAGWALAQGNPKPEAVLAVAPVERAQFRVSEPESEMGSRAKGSVGAIMESPSWS